MLQHILKKSELSLGFSYDRSHQIIETNGRTIPAISSWFVKEGTTLYRKSEIEFAKTDGMLIKTPDDEFTFIEENRISEVVIGFQETGMFEVMRDGFSSLRMAWLER